MKFKCSPETVVILHSRDLVEHGLSKLCRGIGFDVFTDVKALPTPARLISSVEIVLLELHADDNPEPAINHILKVAPAIRVVVLADKVSQPQMKAAFAAGAAGYLLKRISSKALHENLDLVRSGKNVSPSEFFSKSKTSSPSHRRKNDWLDSQLTNLSDREKKILTLLMVGQSNEWIANHLQLTDQGFKNDLKSILRTTCILNPNQLGVSSPSNSLSTTQD